MQRDTTCSSKSLTENMLKESLLSLPTYDSKAPSFSVVMINRNEIMTIKQSLNSLRNQTFPPQEIIVIDAGSGDGSLEVAQAIADKVYGPVKPWARARLLGISASKGSFICSADSDTIYPQRYLENAFKHLSKPKVMAVTGPFKPLPRSHFSLRSQAQAAFSYMQYMIVPYVNELNLCFNKRAFMESIQKHRGYWMRRLINNPYADIGFYVKCALDPRFAKDMLVYTRLPTKGVDIVRVLKYCFRYYFPAYARVWPRYIK